MVNETKLFLSLMHMILPSGGFASLYKVLTTMEEAGRCQRGYFLESLGGAQFATASTVDRLRTHADSIDDRQGALRAVAWGPRGGPRRGTTFTKGAGRRGSHKSNKSNKSIITFLIRSLTKNNKSNKYQFNNKLLDQD